MASWFETSWSEMLAVWLTACIMYTLLIVYTRFSGLRSFSKMSGFDFAITVSIGSVLAGVIMTKDPSALLGGFTLGVLFVLQKLLAFARERLQWVEALVGNRPLVLVYEGNFYTSNMARAHVTRQDILAKLREANVLNMSQVRAVILESTGDVSVLHSSSTSETLAHEILEHVDWGNAAPFERVTSHAQN